MLMGKMTYMHAEVTCLLFACSQLDLERDATGTNLGATWRNLTWQERSWTELDGNEAGRDLAGLELDGYGNGNLTGTKLEVDLDDTGT